MTKKRDELLGIIISQGEINYLVPNVVIAEIFTLEHMTQGDKEKTPTWIMGYITWQNLQLPLVVLNNIVPDSPFHLNQYESTEQPRIAVINPLTHQGKPHYAVFCSKIPKLARLKPHDLEEFTPDDPEFLNHSEHESIACSLIYQQDAAFIPHLIWLEEQISNQESYL